MIRRLETRDWDNAHIKTQFRLTFIGVECVCVCVRVCGCNVGVCVCVFIVCASNTCSTMLLVVGASADYIPNNVHFGLTVR